MLVVIIPFNPFVQLVPFTNDFLLGLGVVMYFLSFSCFPVLLKDWFILSFLISILVTSGKVIDIINKAVVCKFCQLTL